TDPDIRYDSLARCIGMFRKRNDEEENELSPLFLSMLESAPDKRGFLGEPRDRFYPSSWSGSLAHILEQRKSRIEQLADNADPHVQAWARDAARELDPWIESERARDRAMEATFE
ncbi:MAG TPA: hypothetical protein VF683_09290, partial [Chthoniobacterales bacterium]